MQPVRLILKVNSFKDVPFSYPFCKVCLRKIQSSENSRWSCRHCGFWQRDDQVRHRYKMTFSVTDGQRLANVTVFGKSLESMIGSSADAFNKYLTELESVPVLNENRISIHDLLCDAIQHIFCGSFFSFTLMLPQKKVRNQPNTDLKWLQSVCSGDLIAQDIGLASNREISGNVIDAMNHIIDRLIAHAGQDSSSSESSCLSEELQDGCLSDSTSSSHGIFCNSFESTIDSQSILAPDTQKSTSSDPSPYQSLLKGLTFSPWIDVDIPVTSSTPINTMTAIDSGRQKSRKSKGKCIRELLPVCKISGEKSRSCEFLNLSATISFNGNLDSSASRLICDRGSFRKNRHCRSSTNIVDGSLSPDMFA